MNYDLTKLTEDQLLAIFQAVVSQPGPLTMVELKEIAELDYEMERRTAKLAGAIEEAVTLELNQIDPKIFRAGGRA